MNAKTQKAKLIELLNRDGIDLIKPDDTCRHGKLALLHRASGKIVADFCNIPQLCHEWGIS